jgi:hypothetical protein
MVWKPLVLETEPRPPHLHTGQGVAVWSDLVGLSAEDRHQPVFKRSFGGVPAPPKKIRSKVLFSWKQDLCSQVWP